MKGSCALVASLLTAASTLAFSYDFTCLTGTTTPSSTVHQLERRKEVWSAQNAASRGDKFAPKFDGLRFIETLITAHR